MINILITLIFLFAFVAGGELLYAIKTIFQLLLKIVFKILNLFGIRLKKKEKKYRLSKEFKEVYGDDIIVRISKENTKQISSVHWAFLTAFIVSVIMFTLNLALHGVITNFILDIIVYIISDIDGVVNISVISTLYNTLLISIASFSLSKIFDRWKNTKEQRIENRNARLKKKALHLMDSEELLFEIKNKDKQNYEEMKK